MEMVGQLEAELIHEDPDHYLNIKTCSSFHPFEYPEGVSRRERESLATEDPLCCQLPLEDRFLPCHYFDYICGSGTGA